MPVTETVGHMFYEHNTQLRRMLVVGQHSVEEAEINGMVNDVCREAGLSVTKLLAWSERG